jgi:hypothetical protein
LSHVVPRPLVVSDPSGCCASSGPTCTTCTSGLGCWPVSRRCVRSAYTIRGELFTLFHFLSNAAQGSGDAARRVLTDLGSIYFPRHRHSEYTHTRGPGQAAAAKANRCMDVRNATRRTAAAPAHRQLSFTAFHPAQAIVASEEDPKEGRGQSFLCELSQHLRWSFGLVWYGTGPINTYSALKRLTPYSCSNNQRLGWLIASLPSLNSASPSTHLLPRHIHS